MNEAIIRTEDIDPKDIQNFFVETERDREIINQLKGKQPLLVVGSRGTGKTMLLRMAEQELLSTYSRDKVLPVFVNLVTCNIYDKKNILKVLISRTLRALQQSLKAQGIILTGSIFKPITNIITNPIIIKLEEYINESNATQEESEGYIIDNEQIKEDVDQLIIFLSELSSEFKIKRINFLFDEACQVFQPTHQRVFFEFFRALRNYQITCKAAVYPGIVTYGSFQKFHDVTEIRIQRSITDSDYINKMRQVIQKHYPEDYQVFEKHGDLLNSIIYASTGNPRFLLKSINEIIAGQGKFNSANINSKIKEFYGTTIWSEHTKLSEMYSGHTDMIDWSRNFIEDTVLSDIEEINQNPSQKTTIYFCISRNASAVIQQSIKTLEYSGILSLHTEGTKYRTEMYDRYEINLGIVVLHEKQVNIQQRIKEIIDNISIKVFPDYGKNSLSYGDYSKLADISQFEADSKEMISHICTQDISSLDISYSMQKRLKDYGLNTIEQVLSQSEEDLQKIPYIGEVRSRKINNLVYNAILEYISG